MTSVIVCSGICPVEQLRVVKGMIYCILFEFASYTKMNGTPDSMIPVQFCPARVACTPEN